MAQHSTVIHNKQYTTQQTIHNTKYIVGYIISFETFIGLVKADFGEMVCLSSIGLTVCWQMMFVDSDRWLVCWQMTVWFSNDDSHCEIRREQPMDISYYRVGGKNSKDEMSSAFSRVLLLDVLLRLWILPVLAAECGRHLCILPCTRSACETVWNKDRCTESSYIRCIRNWIYDEHPLSCLPMECWNRLHNPLSIPYILNRCRDWLQRVVVLPLQAKGWESTTGRQGRTLLPT